MPAPSRCGRGISGPAGGGSGARRCSAGGRRSGPGGMGRRRRPRRAWARRSRRLRRLRGRARGSCRTGGRQHGEAGHTGREGQCPATAGGGDRHGAQTTQHRSAPGRKPVEAAVRRGQHGCRNGRGRRVALAERALDAVLADLCAAHYARLLRTAAFLTSQGQAQSGPRAAGPSPGPATRRYRAGAPGSPTLHPWGSRHSSRTP